MVTTLSGLTVIQVLSSSRAVGIVGDQAMAARRDCRPDHPEHQPAAGQRAGADERASCPFAHGGPHSVRARAWMARRTRANVPQRQMLVMASSTSTSVACGLSASSADTAMIIPDWQ